MTDIRYNALSLIRLLAAFQVMYGHITNHLDITMPNWLDVCLSYFNGVPIFFVLSGYLIWDSVGRSENYRMYLEKRFWRIYPELWVGVLLEAVTIVILYASKINLGEFLLFILGQMTILQFWTPTSLRGYGCGTPNGSLWTICVLIQFYLIVWVIRKKLHNTKIKYWMITMVIILVGHCGMKLILEKMQTPLFDKLYYQTVIPYLYLFLVGTFIAEYRAYILSKKKYWLLLILLAVLAQTFDLDLGLMPYSILKCVSMAVGLIGFAYCYPKLKIKRDITYGLYIYHMIVVNVMIMLGQTGNRCLLFVAVAFSVLLAWFSTKYIGRFTMLLRKRLDSK